MMNIEEIAKKRFGENFKFRKGQLEVIQDILDVFFAGEKNLYLLDAPTGSGKSIIAITVADCINSVGLKGYILTSDLALFDQYVKDVKYFPNFGHIKGAENYSCVVNHEKFTLGDCKIKNVSYEKAESLSCFSECGYLYNRKRAIKSPTTITTYAYWLVQRNYVEGKMQERGKGVPFPKRDFTLCDEAHKVSDIVQNHFSPRVDEKILEKLEKLRAVFSKQGVPAPKFAQSRLRIVIKNIFREETPDRIYALIKELELCLVEYVKAGNTLKEKVGKQFPGEMEVPKEMRFNLGIVDWVKDMHCKFEDYNHIISQVGIGSMIKNPQGDQVVFNCLDESYMMERHFHSQAGFKLLMTATMGEPSTFLRTIGATDARYYRMDSNFDYEKSPIYFYPKRRMSMSQKEKTLPWAANKVNELLNSHPDDSGIIHSGSYDIAARIFEQLSDETRKRTLVYQGSQEKEKALQRFLSEKNLVLMGPSLLEGLDLFSDKSRFQVFVKIPFPSLGDRFVNAKMNHVPDWYDWVTITQVLQGIGRSVRSKDDWAITYVLDGCLTDLLRRRRSSFPPEFQRRIKVVSEDI